MNKVRHWDARFAYYTMYESAQRYAPTTANVGLLITAVVLCVVAIVAGSAVVAFAKDRFSAITSAPPF